MMEIHGPYKFEEFAVDNSDMALDYWHDEIPSGGFWGPAMYWIWERYLTIRNTCPESLKTKDFVLRMLRPLL